MLIGSLFLVPVLAAYSEHLSVSPLSKNKVFSEFTFEVSQPTLDLQGEMKQFTDFPRSLGQILDLSNSSEIHLRFGQGSWDEANWGALPHNGTSSGGIGVELWAFVDGEDTPQDLSNGAKEDPVAFKNWQKLTNALGGYFCASINFINDASTTWPSEELLPRYGELHSNSRLLRGALPAEPICTENLTPFLKLLPCRGKAGIASLLDGHTLFSARWQSMTVDVWVSEGETHLRQRISAVHDTNKVVKDLPYATKYEDLICDKSKPWANDWTCFPLTSKEANFDISDIFGSEINGVCPQATTDTVVEVKIPSQLSGSEPFVVNNHTLEVSGHEQFVLARNEQFNLNISSPSVSKPESVDVTPLLVDRSISSIWGQQQGGVRAVFENTKDYPLRVLYLDTLPWFMRLYLHTTKVSGEGAIVDTQYTPSIDRQRPSTLELELVIEPHGRFELDYTFDRSLLYLEEYPPDANHGFEIPPALAVVLSSDSRYEVRTSSLLLGLPVPDFSMPYNVIILTSTVMAMAFGTIYNLVDREVCPEDKVPPRGSLKDVILKKLRLR